MKKILFVLSIALLAIAFTPLSVDAQLKSFTASNGLARDTVTNTGSETWVVATPGKAHTIGIQIAVTKVSGTVGGTIVVQGSTDGTIYHTISSTSQTPSDASANYGWEITDSKWQYYRLLFTGTGTMVASAIAKAVVRKE